MIDKSARQYYANGQLVKPTRHGLRPGYRGDDYNYGGVYSGGGNQNTGKEKDSHFHPGIASTYSAPAPAPAPTPKEKRDAEKKQATIDLEFYRDPIMNLADKQKEQDKKMLQERIENVNKLDLPLNYSADDLKARAKRAMTQPGWNIDSDPNEYFFTAKMYDPYKVDTTPVETVSKNPIGGLDQFAKEVEFLEANYPNQKISVENLPGTLRDFYTNKQPVPAGSKFKVVPDDIDFRSAPSTVAVDVGFQEALRKQQIATDLRQKQQNLNYGQFFKPTPVVEKPQGIMSSLVDKGKGIASNMVRQSILQKLGLGFLNPFIGIASLFGFDPIETLMAKLPRGTGTKTAWTKPREGEGKEQYKKEFITTEPKDVITESIKKFKPTDQQTAQINEIMRKKMILQGYADKGTLNEKGMNVLAQMNQLINQYQVNPESIWT